MSEYLSWIRFHCVSCRFVPSVESTAPWVSRFNDSWHKSSVLTAFKNTVTKSHQEFDDDDQKVSSCLCALRSTLISVCTFAPETVFCSVCVCVRDAHEFLVCTLDVLQCEFSKLQAEAAALDKPSICPVRAHIGFTMLSIQFSVIPEWWARTLCLTFAQRGQNNYKAHQSVVVNVCNVLLDQVSLYSHKVIQTFLPTPQKI